MHASSDPLAGSGDAALTDAEREFFVRPRSLVRVAARWALALVRGKPRELAELLVDGGADVGSLELEPASHARQSDRARRDQQAAARAQREHQAAIIERRMQDAKALGRLGAASTTAHNYLVATTPVDDEVELARAFVARLERDQRRPAIVRIGKRVWAETKRGTGLVIRAVKERVLPRHRSARRDFEAIIQPVPVAYTDPANKQMYRDMARSQAEHQNSIVARRIAAEIAFSRTLRPSRRPSLGPTRRPGARSTRRRSAGRGTSASRGSPGSDPDSEDASDLARREPGHKPLPAHRRGPSSLSRDRRQRRARGALGIALELVGAAKRAPRNVRRAPARAPLGDSSLLALASRKERPMVTRTQLRAFRRRLSRRPHRREVNSS